MTEHNAAEKRALAARTNAYMELGKIVAQVCKQNLGLVTIPPGANVALIVPHNPAGVMATVEQLQQTVKQMEISMGVLVDMLLEENHVCAVPDPHAGPGDLNPAPRLAPSQLTLENFLNRCATVASRNAETIRRAVLSQGVPAEVSRIIKPS